MLTPLLRLPFVLAREKSADTGIAAFVRDLPPEPEIEVPDFGALKNRLSG